jgi:hypothetical protein
MQLLPLLQYVWEGRARKEWRWPTVISIFIPFLFKPLSPPPAPHLDTKINKPPSSFNHAFHIQLILKIMKYIVFLQYFNKI